MKTDEVAFSINFLRREMTPPSIRRFLAYLVLGYFAVNVLAMASLIAGTVGTQMKLGQILSSLGDQPPSAPVAKALKGESTTLRRDVSANLSRLDSVAVFYNERFRVAGKLAGLARTLPARTWISELQGSRGGRSLRIEATHVVDPDNPYEEPDKNWIPALRSDAEFGQGLKRLESLKSSQKKQGNTELYFFELTAEWSPEKGPS